MKNPQTYCLTVKKTLSPERLETIHKYGCCAFVLLWCLGIEPEDLNAIELVSDMIDAKVIESDCTVHWKEAVKFLTGRDITIQFQDIKDILKIKDRTPVRYDYKGIKAILILIAAGAIFYIFVSLAIGETIGLRHLGNSDFWITAIGSAVMFLPTIGIMVVKAIRK